MSAEEGEEFERIAYEHIIKHARLLLSGRYGNSEAWRKAVKEAGFTIVDVPPVSGGATEVSYWTPTGDFRTSRIAVL